MSLAYLNNNASQYINFLAFAGRLLCRVDREIPLESYSKANRKGGTAPFRTAIRAAIYNLGAPLGVIL